jgi:hypothetical protein
MSECTGQPNAFPERRFRKRIAEGFALLPLGEHRSRLEQWFETDVLQWFGDRILSVTKEIADRRGTHGLTVVARNFKDFARLGFTTYPFSDNRRANHGVSAEKTASHCLRIEFIARSVANMENLDQLLFLPNPIDDSVSMRLLVVQKMPKGLVHRRYRGAPRVAAKAADCSFEPGIPAAGRLGYPDADIPPLPCPGLFQPLPYALLRIPQGSKIEQSLIGCRVLHNSFRPALDSQNHRSLVLELLHEQSGIPPERGHGMNVFCDIHHERAVSIDSTFLIAVVTFRPPNRQSSGPDFRK